VRNIASLRAVRAVRRWCAGEEGATLVEYALILVLLVAAVLAAIELLNESARQPLERITQVITAPAFEEGQSPSADGARPSDLPTTTAVVSFQNWRWAGVAISLFLNCVLWYLCYRRQHRHRQNLLEHRQELLSAVPEEELFTIRQQMLKSLSAHIQELLDGHLLVRNLLLTEPCIVALNDSVQVVQEKLQQRRLRHALVCGPAGELRGVISRTDLIGQHGTASDVMTINPLTVAPAAPLGATITRLLTEGVSCLPVIQEDQRPCGVLTTFDLVLGLQCTLMTLQTMTAQQELSASIHRPRTISSVVQQQLNAALPADAVVPLNPT